jgi:MFS transporter, MCT family, solute carrier family 16 (monocarboxylic acid transporters), member 10
MTDSLLTHNNHVVVVPAKTFEKKVEPIEPPDGGARAYIVMISAFLCNGILFGIINTYSVIYVSLQRQLEASGDAAASSKACELLVAFLKGNFNYVLSQKLGNLAKMNF